MKEKVVFMISMLLCLSFNAFAKNDSHLKLLIRELNLYTEKNIVPEFKKQRSKLNAHLSYQDLKRIAVLSKSYFDLEEKKKNLFNNKATSQEARMKIWDEIQKEKLIILGESADIAEKYAIEIEKLLRELEINKQQWRNEMNLIIDKYNALIDVNTLRRFKKYNFGEWAQGEYFIVWWADQNILKEAEASAEDGFSIYPNPSKDMQRIKFSLQEASNVEILLTDNQGNVIQTFAKKSFPEGTHTIDISLQTLGSNVYYYQIITSKGKEVKRIFKE